MASCEKKLVKQKSGLKIVPVNESLQSPFLMSEPKWVPDGECSGCIDCGAKFDFFQRRHHCRRCGKCFCAKCCGIKCMLPRMCFVDPVLHCNMCASVSCKENEFFQQHVKVLIQGSVFFLTGSSFGEDSGALFMCRLTSDHRFMNLEPLERNPFISLEPIELRRIESARMLSSAKGPLAGGTSTNGLAVRYTDPDEQPQDIQLMMVENSSRKQAAEWLAAFQKALKMVLEIRGGVH